MIDFMQLPAHEAERLAYAEGFTGTAALFKRLDNMQHALGQATAEIVTLRDALEALAVAAESAADPETIGADMLQALQGARTLLQYAEGLE